ncbi:MAG: Mth938-like domain-containing protein [Candidatus Kariarchaeaceae archaeon]|jgi:hypothetical protein
MARISSYSFGKIIVDGTTHRKDLIICPNRVIPTWWRKEGHTLHIEDLDMISPNDAKLLVIGTGESGRMKVNTKVKALLKHIGYDLIIKPTPQAVVDFNAFCDQQPTIGAFHLTC